MGWTNLTSGSATSNGSATASVTLPNGALIVLATAAAETGGGAPTAITPSGLTLDWGTTKGIQTYATRRALSVWVALNNTGSEVSGTIAITATMQSGSYQQHAWCVDKYEWPDAGTPTDAAVASQSGGATTTHTLADVGTPGVGDSVYCAFAFENTADSFAISAPFTTLAAVDVGGGGNVRQLHSAYDDSGTPDETPSATWTTSGSNNCAGIAFIVNAGAPPGTPIPPGHSSPPVFYVDAGDGDFPAELQLPAWFRMQARDLSHLRHAR